MPRTATFVLLALSMLQSCTRDMPPGHELRAETQRSAEQTKPIRVGSTKVGHKILRRVRAVYPADAKAEGVHGTVRLNLRIDKKGHVAEIKVESSPDHRLSQAAVDAVSQWLFAPMLLNGTPVEIATVVDINFTLR